MGYNSADVVLFSETNQPENVYYSSNNAVFDLASFHCITTCEPEYTERVSIANSPNLQGMIFKTDSIMVTLAVTKPGIFFKRCNAIGSNCTSSVLGAETVTAQQFIIALVRVRNILEIHSGDNLVVSGIEIYNNLGRLVRNQIGDIQRIGVSSLANGIYCLKIESDSLTDTKKFLKQ